MAKSGLVLCVDRRKLDSTLSHDTSLYNQSSTGLYVFNSDIELGNILNNQEYSILNRRVVDDVHDTTSGYNQPQILAYCVVIVNDKIMSYSRHAGAGESRLRGNKSIGVGGHVDFTDVKINDNEIDGVDSIINSAIREIKEEVNQDVEELTFKGLIIDKSDKVGLVHVGVFCVITLEDVEATEEIKDFEFLDISELKSNIEDYESWSKLIIQSL